MAYGPQRGLAILQRPELVAALDAYHLYHAACADLLRRAGYCSQAEAAYRRALSLTQNEVEQTYLRRRLGEVMA